MSRLYTLIKMPVASSSLHRIIAAEIFAEAAYPLYLKALPLHRNVCRAR